MAKRKQQRMKHTSPVGALWTRHDLVASDDEKIVRLLASHGWEGYGLYWGLVERMGRTSDAALRFDDLDDIAFGMRTDAETLRAVVETCADRKLFRHDDVAFWSVRLRAEIGHLIARKNNASKAAETRWNAERSKQADADAMRPHSERNANAMRMHSERNADAMLKQDRTGQEITENENNVSPSPRRGSGYSPDFDLFWSSALTHYKTAGCQPGTKAEAWNEWRKISDRDPSAWLEAMAKHSKAIQAGKRSGDFVTPLKHVCRWLKHRAWEVDVAGPESRSVVEDGYAEGLRIAAMMGRTE